MRTKHLAVILLLFMLVISASIPVYASHTTRKEPSEDEKRLFEEIFARLEKHEDLMESRVDDVKKSLSDPVKIFFSCRNVAGRAVESAMISITTEHFGFDEGVAAMHKDVTLGAMYIWDCRAVMDSYTLTLECTNLLMLNPDFIAREETETREKRIIAIAENEMMLYHEFLHGQLMMNAMKDTGDALGWRADACRFFANNNNEIDYSASDAEHMIIPVLENKFLSKLIEMNHGFLIVQTLSGDIGPGKFTHHVANFEELGGLSASGMYLFARTTNMEETEILVSSEKETISITGRFLDPEEDATVNMFIMPRLDAADARIELSVDEAVKKIGSEFVFTAKVRNLQPIDITGGLTLFVDGIGVAREQLVLPSGETHTLQFTWASSGDTHPSMHSILIDGFNSISNEVSVMTFERLVSSSIRGDGTIGEQTITDPQTGSQVVVARPERISATVIAGDSNYDLRVFAPDGTLVVGEEGLVNSKGNRASIVEVAGQTLVVKFRDLNERLVFLGVKSAGGGQLPEGEWVMKAVDTSGDDAGAKIKYYASYVKT